MRAYVFLKMTFVLFCLASVATVVSAAEDRYAEEYSCIPVHGIIKLPGVKYDDLTPLARERFKNDPAAVSNALYALPLEDREAFIQLYLEQPARDRHRFFFARCKEIADRKALEITLESGEIIPRALRQELLDRESRRRFLREDALIFKVANRNVYFPAPDHYVAEALPFKDYIRDARIADSMVVYRKLDSYSIAQPDYVSGREQILASVNHVRESRDSVDTMIQAYQSMVDDTWRITSVIPPEATVDKADKLTYRWNLRPFRIRGNAFCYGQFEKTVDKNGITEVSYRATAVILLPGCYVQVGIFHGANTRLETVDEINTDLANWRDAILAANWE